MAFVCQHDYAGLLLSLAPAGFTLGLVLAWRGIDSYIEKEVSTIPAKEKLTAGQRNLLSAMARSSISLHNFIASVLNAIITTLIAVATFPERANRIAVAVILVAALLIFFIRWVTRVISFKIYELSTTYVPYSKISRRIFKKKISGTTYAELLHRHEIMLVGIIAATIVGGYALTRCTWV